MLRICRWKMLDLILFEYEKKCKFIPKGWQFSSHLMTGGNVKDFSPKNAYVILN